MTFRECVVIAMYRAGKLPSIEKALKAADKDFPSVGVVSTTQVPPESVEKISQAFSKMLELIEQERIQEN